MKPQHTIVLLLFLATCLLRAQSQVPDYMQLVNNFNQGIENRSFKDMKRNAEDLIKYYSDDYAGYALNGYFLVCRGQNTNAEAQFQTMIQLNPFDAGAYGLMAMQHFIMKRYDDAEKYLHWSYQLNPADYTTTNLLKDTDVVIDMASRPDLEDFKKMVIQISQNYPVNEQAGPTLTQCYQMAKNGEACNGLQQAIGKLNTFKPHNPMFEVLGAYAKAYKDYMAYEPKKAIDGFDHFLKQSEPHKEQLYYLRAVSYFGKAYINAAEYQHNIALVNIKRALEEVKKMPVTTQLEAQFLQAKITYEKELQLFEDMSQTGYNLLAAADKLDDDYYRAHANNSIGSDLIFSILPADQAKGTEMLFTALQQATKVGDDELLNSIRGNYMVALYQRGRKEEVKTIFRELFTDLMNKKDYMGAEITANNMGFLMLYENEYAEAASYFKQAVDLTENFKQTLTPPQRMALMNNNSSSYYGLVMAYQKLGKTAELFETQDKNRSQFLKERLQPNATHATIKDAQQLLGTDDVLLYYTLAGPGEVIINAITQTTAKVYYSYPIDAWIGMKKQWTDRTKKVPPSYNSFMQGYANDIVDGNFVVYQTKEQNFNADDFKTQVDWTRQLLKSDDPAVVNARTAFLKHWYQVTLQPLEGLLATKKNIIISADKELNYLPFEAFIKPSGNYLIESHNVRYIPSVSVWKLLNNRNYPANRKPALVMGGALYQPSGNVKGTARGIDDFYAISESLNAKIERNNFNFKEELEKVGFGGASYLQGTLDEVLFVGELDPNIKVVTGKDMTESYLKQLDAKGELKNYSIFMISSHGFTTDIIPEFSGVMMTQPNAGDGNEDTFLLAPEIANLKLQADLAILSACDTGLGALVGGEGVNGLNSAFLVAGANNTLLSLWPVNDSSTALTMKNLFRLVLIEGLDSFTALNTIKRAMAMGEGGEELKNPMHWAPFLLSGR